MFDTVGQERSKETAGRKFASLAMSLLVNGGFLGALLFAGRQVAEEVLDELPVEVTFFDAAPPPPPPPPPAGGGSKPKVEKKEEPKEPDPEPDDMVEPDPEELVEEELEEVEEAVEEDGVVGGQEGGVKGGVIGGVVGGEIGGVIGGQLGGTGKSVHWTQVKIRRQIKPKMPSAAHMLDFDQVKCKVRFYIDEKGAPYDIEMVDCPKVFHESTLKAAWKWRFYPYREKGKAMKSTFVLAVTFKLKD